MPITSSETRVDAHQQRNGGRCVLEVLVDSEGREHRSMYGPVPEGFDYAAHLSATVARMNAELADSEATGLWESGEWKPLAHQTGAQLAARFRAAYRDATAQQAARMAWWLIERINAVNFTDAQVRNAFGLTMIQYTQMKNRMTTLHDQYAAVVAARGE